MEAHHLCKLLQYHCSMFSLNSHILLVTFHNYLFSFFILSVLSSQSKGDIMPNIPELHHPKFTSHFHGKEDLETI